MPLTIGSLVAPACDQLAGGNGNDVLEEVPARTRVFGGAGVNVASYSGSTSAVSVNLATGIPGGGDAKEINCHQIADLIGSDFNDFLTGDTNSNWLSGGAGGDLLSGGTGDDWLEGGAEADVLAGGAGADTFLYQDVADSGVILRRHATESWIFFEGAIGSTFRRSMPAGRGG